MTLEVQLLHTHATPPTRTRAGDVGYDLSCVEDFFLLGGQRDVIPTGVAVALPDGVAGLIVPRSGLAACHGLSIVNGPGLIDPTYRGELKVVLINTGWHSYQGHAGDRIAQLLLVPFLTPETRVVDVLSASADDRAASGFGSSGR